MLKLSIVSPFYNGQEYIEAFYHQISESVKELNVGYEIILIDDGSSDSSLEKVKHFAEVDSNLIVLQLSKNFGHHKAMMAGLAQAQGEYVFLIDSDLEEDPSLIKPFWTYMQEVDNVDVIFGVQNQRKGKLSEKLSGWLFYTLFNVISSVKIPRNLSTIRLMTRDYVSALLLHQEKNIFLAGLMQLNGFQQHAYKFTKLSRGKSSYTIGKKLRLLVDAVTGFSSAPLIYIFYLGLFITTFSMSFAVYYTIRQLMYQHGVSGWTSLMVSIWFIAGIIIFSLGLIGIYLAKIYTEVKNRPNHIIKEVFNKKENC